MKCSECQYYKVLPFKKESGNCLVNPPVSKLVSDRNGVPVVVSMYPEVKHDAFCMFFKDADRD